jgi:hypothetical protein
MPIFLMFTRSGSSFITVGAYTGVVLLFPTTVAATTAGVCNIFARILTTLSPLIAELPQPYPMSYIISVSLICLFMSRSLIEGAK